MNALHRAWLPLALALVALPTVAHGAAPFNEIQKKYLEREGPMCKPTGALKELVAGKYKCYAPAGAEKCGATLDAAKGTLDPQFFGLFGDLLKLEKPGEYAYAANCQDLTSAEFAHFLAIGGASYAKSPALLDALVALAAPASIDKMSAQLRSELVAAFGRYGEASKARIVPALKNALAAPGKMLDFKKNALKLLARFGSDDGVAYCMDVLQKDNDKDVAKVCGFYLAERKHAPAMSVFVKRYEEDKRVWGRAIGLLGGKDVKDAIAVLKEDYEKNAGSVVAVTSTVALLNLGDKSYDYAGDLVAMIKGKRPLSLKDRAKKAEELKAKKKGAEDRWKKREDETQEEIARAAAIESTFLVDAAAAKKVDEALKATAAQAEWIKASATASSALAQRGDKAAIGALVKLLSSPKKEARDIALFAFGARYDVPEAFLEYVGRKGVVADATVPPALFKFIEGEAKEETRVQALLAIGAVRSFL